MADLQTIEERAKRLRQEPLPSNTVTEVKQPAVSDDPLAARALQLNAPEAIEAQKNLDATEDLDPDNEAKIYDLSKQSGFPVNTVRNAQEEVEKALGRPAYTLPDPSLVQRYLGRIDNAAMSRDDVPELEKVQTLWEKTKQAFEEGDIDQKINILTTRRELLGANPIETNKRIGNLEKDRERLLVDPAEQKLADEIFNAPTQEAAQKIIDRAKREKGKKRKPGFIEKVLTSTARQIPQQLSSLEQALGRAIEGGAIGATGALLLGQTGPQVLTPEEVVTVPAGFLGGAGLGFKFGQIEGIFNQEFGGAFREFSDIQDDQGNKIDPTVVKVMAFGAASINAVFEFASFKAFVKTFPGGSTLLSKMTPEFIRKTASSAAIRDRLKQIAANAGKAWTTEIATEVMQESVTVLLGELSKQLQTELTGAEFKDFDFDVFTARLQEIATETMYSAFGFILPGTAASTAKTVADATISKDFHDNNDSMKAAVDDTKTQERSPDHSGRFTDLLQMGTVLMSPEGIERLYQDSTVEEADAILTKVGVNPQEARRVAAAGQDVEFTQSKQLTQLTTEEFGKIKDDVKPAPGAYTRREINDQKAEEDVEATVKLLAEKSAVDKKVTAEITRLEEEGKVAGIDPALSEDAPVLLKGLADRLASQGRDPVKFLADISIKKERFKPIKDLIARGKQLLQSAFHGTPFRFDKFSLDHLGKGEGAQAFGWGLYFAEKKDIADWYRRALLHKRKAIDVIVKHKGARVDPKTTFGGMIDDIAFSMGNKIPFLRAKQIATQRFIDNNTVDVEKLEQDRGLFTEEEFALELEDVKEAKASLEKVQAVIESDIERTLSEPTAGATFKVELPGDEQILNWEKRLDLTGENTKSIFSDIILLDKKTEEIDPNYISNTRFINHLKRMSRGEKFDSIYSGMDVYTELSRMLDGDKEASEWLSEHGIKGHKFWDGESRNSSGAKTFNFVIYDDEVIDIVETFFQAEKAAPPGRVGTPRGALTLQGEKRTIQLFENADPSTVFHEIAHVGLLEYTAIERTGEASKELQKDIDVLRKWVGAKEGADFTREQSEQVARGFEAYLMEGIAPTPELRTAFERIKQIMISIYKTVKKLDVKLNKQVRGVFDRMLSANLEVEAAAQAGGFTIQTNEEMDNLGMIKEDRIFAAGLIEQVKRKAESNLTKARNKGLRSLRKKWREESRGETRAEDKIYSVVDTIILKAGEFNLDELEVIRAEVEEGEAPQRLAVRDKDGDIIRWIGIPSTFPEYFKDRKLKKDETLKIIDKALEGKVALTERQITTLEILAEGYRDQTARLIEQVGGDLSEFEDLFLEGETRLNRDEFIARYGADQIDNLLNSAVLVKDGAQIDQIAITFGYEDADVFVEEMLTTPPFNEAVEQRFNQKQAEHDASFVVEDYMVDLKEYRDYLELIARYVTGKGVDQQAVDTGIQRNIKRWEREAETAITNEQPLLTGTERAEAIRERVQERIETFTRGKAKPSVITTDTLKRLARETMAAKSVREARRVDKFLSAAKKASSEGRRAILKENWGEASRQGELERFNYEMAGLSTKVREEVKAFENRSKKAGRQKSLGAEYKEAILHLISRFNIASMLPQNPQTPPNYNSLFAPDDFSAGYAAPAFITDGSVGDYRDLRVEQLRDLDSAIRFLKKHGDPQDKNIMKDGVTRIQEDVVEPIVKKGESVRVKKVFQKGSMIRKLTDFTRPKFSRIDSLNFTGIAVDGYTNLGKDPVKGLFEKFVIDALKASDNERLVIKKEIEPKLRPHIAQIGKTLKKWRKEKGQFFEVEGAPVPERIVADGQYTGWKPDQIMAMMLNLGNESNSARLFNGYPDLTGQHVEKLMDLLSKEDWQAIQGVWDVMESLFSETNEVHLRMEGYRITKIDARPLRTKHGVFSGGYYPAKYDGTLDFNTEARDEIEVLLNGEEAKFVVPYAKKNHTQLRTEKAGDLPILLNLSVINSHFEDVIHYIAYAETIRDSNRIIDNTISVEKHGTMVRAQPIKDLVKRILGKDVMKSMIPSLKHIANPNYVGYDQPSGKKWISIGRSLSTAYILAHNTGVALKQPLSTFGAIHDLGGGLEGFKKYINGFFSVLSSPAAHYQMMLDLSDYMGDRMSNFDRELRKTFQKLTSEQKMVYWGDKAVTWDDVVSFGFWQIRLADTVTVMPIWHGAFADRLNDTQTNVQEAVDYADDIVRNSQPSAQALDLSSWQRDAGVFRLFSQFQTFTVGKYGQRQRLYYRAWRNKSISNTEYAWFNFMDAFMPLVAVNFMFGVIHGQDFKDPEEQKSILFKIFSSWLTMGVPIASNLISALDFGSPLDSPTVKTVEKLWNSTLTGLKALDGFDNKKEREAALWAIARVFSIIMRVPLDKIVSKAIRGAKSNKSLAGIDWLVPPPKKSRGKK